MATQRFVLPTIEAEFRGLVRESGERLSDDGGETIKWGKKYRFEYEDAGVLQEIELTGAQLDNAEGGVDVLKLTRGQRVRIDGAVIVRDGFFIPTSVVPAASVKAA